MTDADARLPTDTEAGPELAGLRVSVSGESEEGAGAEEAGEASARRPRPTARRRLVRLLVAKAVVDLLFVCALAAGVHHAAFRPTFRGALESADAAGVRGWVVDESGPGRRVEVQLYLDGRLAAATVADRPLAEGTAASEAGDGRQAFVFELRPPPPGEHEARVYALNTSADGRRRTLQQIGNATVFVVKGEGK
jgi:hypothetical protein